MGLPQVDGEAYDTAETSTITELCLQVALSLPAWHSIYMYVCLMLPTPSTWSCVHSKTRCSDFFLAIPFPVLFVRHKLSCDTVNGRNAAVDDEDWTECRTATIDGITQTTSGQMFGETQLWSICTMLTSHMWKITVQ